MNWPALQTIRLTKLAAGILKAIVPVKIQPIKSNLILLIFFYLSPFLSTRIIAESELLI